MKPANLRILFVIINCDDGNPSAVDNSVDVSRKVVWTSVRAIVLHILLTNQFLDTVGDDHHDLLGCCYFLCGSRLDVDASVTHNVFLF